MLRQIHLPGEKMFVDWAGQKVEIHNAQDGSVSSAHLFVAVLGASNKTFAEAFENEKLAAWIEAHCHAYNFFQGVARITVPDNLKTGVIRPCRYEPLLHRSYQEMAEHYGTVIIPGRIKKPRDKAKVEGAVLIAERQILAALRDQRFFHVGQLNAAIVPLLTRLNAQPFQKLEGSRNSWFEAVEKDRLLPLPATAFELADWSTAKVNIDYHVAVENHFYSAPYQLVHQQLDVRLTDKTVELFQHGKRVAAHRRSYQSGRFTTLEEHRPKSHQRYLAMDSQPHPGVGQNHRAGVRQGRGENHGRPASSRTRLSLRLGHHPPGQGRGPRPLGSRLPARPALWHLFLYQRQLHSPKQPGKPTLGTRAALAQSGPRKSSAAVLTTTKTLPIHIMLITQTLEKLQALRLDGMAQALEEQRRQNDIVPLSFEDRLALLVERQWLWRENRALVTRLKNAQLKINASLEDLDYRPSRGLKRAQIEQLRACPWIKEHRNCLITGPTGCGKTFLACALGAQACREGHRTLYFYAPKFFRALETARADGSLLPLLKKLARSPLVIIDDLGIASVPEKVISRVPGDAR